MDLKSGQTVFLPTEERIANARILSVRSNGSARIHWKGNYNLSGDFSSELMVFDNNLVMNVADEDARNEYRISNGLVALK